MPSKTQRATAQRAIGVAILCACVAFILYAFWRPAPRIESHFTDCTAAIVHELAGARHSVRVQAYSLTSAPIAKELVEANRRGAKVIVIADATNRGARYSVADFLTHEGIETYIDSMHAIAHNKIMIIDERTVLTGSFNFTKAAEANNAENLLIIRDARAAADYERNWQAHFAHLGLREIARKMAGELSKLSAYSHVRQFEITIRHTRSQSGTRLFMLGRRHRPWHPAC